MVGAEIEAPPEAEVDLISLAACKGVESVNLPKLDATTVSGGGLLTDVVKTTRATHEYLEIYPEESVSCPTDTCKCTHKPLKTGAKVKTTVAIIILGIGLEAMLPVAAIDDVIG